MRKWLVLIFFGAVAIAQQVNQDVVPATTGLNIGHSNQQWNGFFNNITISGNCTLNGQPCFSGGGGGGGGGTGFLPNPATQWAMAVYSATGTGTALSGVPVPSGLDGVPQIPVEVTAAGLATAESFQPGGVPTRASVCPSNADLILSTDRLKYISWSDASACAVTLPQIVIPSGFASNFALVGCNIGAGTVTLTPTVSTISYTTMSGYKGGQPSMPLTTGQCAFVYSDNANYFAIQLIGINPASASGVTTPQIGDISRYNINGDGLWDATNYLQSGIGIYANNQTTTLRTAGMFGAGTITPLNNNATNVAPTATSQFGLSIGQTAGASTSTVIGMNFGANGSTSTLGMEAFYRWSFKAALGNTTNVRYWFGLGCFHTAGAGNNGLAFGSTGSVAYATDTPNKSTLGFLYSSGVSSNHFQAVADTAGGSQTNVDTGVVADTNPHLFEMTTNAAGTVVFFFIDNVLVATISTNLPPPANTNDSWGDLFFTGDNKNTATAIALTFYSMQISLK